MQQQETPYSCSHPTGALNSCSKFKSPESFNEIATSVEANNKRSLHDHHKEIEILQSKRESSDNKENKAKMQTIKEVP